MLQLQAILSTPMFTNTAVRHTDSDAVRDAANCELFAAQRLTAGNWHLRITPPTHLKRSAWRRKCRTRFAIAANCNCCWCCFLVWRRRWQCCSLQCCSLHCCSLHCCSLLVYLLQLLSGTCSLPLTLCASVLLAASDSVCISSGGAKKWLKEWRN